MAAEETLRRVGEAVASALGGGETPLPAETPPPTPEPQVDVVQSKKEQFIPAAAEKLQQFAEKITKGVPEAVKKIVRENERPRDARVLSVVSELVSMDEATLADPVSMRRVGERLLTIMADAGPGTPTGEEANKYLQRIIAEHGSLADLRARAQELQGRPGSAIDGLFDDLGHDELAGTALEEKLKKYKQFLRYDAGDMHDTHKISEYIAELKRDAYKDNIPERQVKEAVRRLQDVIGEKCAPPMRSFFEKEEKKSGFTPSLTAYMVFPASAPSRHFRIRESGKILKVFSTGNMAT
ncbi:MAG: hypothetical protein UY10_C0004G0036 [Microgenomates group bacterium GW2011_GWA2_47_8]|nr:MAG: hypothetical protein UY10_C0004G0036 [Microgenomates group bacterium GW2011_GWA2_47_8]